MLKNNCIVYYIKHGGSLKVTLNMNMILILDGTSEHFAYE